MVKTNSNFAQLQLDIINARISQAAQMANRQTSDIQLIGASKLQTWQHMQAFYQAGLKAVGENYLQEAIDKQQKLAATTLEWHFIGQIQSNKSKAIAEHFSWVHGLDRLKIAQRLAKHALQNNSELNILLQLNIDDENSKAGISLQQAPELCQQVAELDGIRLRGFMLIPKARKQLDEQRKPFALARESLQSINQRYALQMDQLSMGMSNDLEAAVLEGATMIRIGTALFGARPSPTNK